MVSGIQCNYFAHLCCAAHLGLALALTLHYLYASHLQEILEASQELLQNIGMVSNNKFSHCNNTIVAILNP